MKLREYRAEKVKKDFAEEYECNKCGILYTSRKGALMCCENMSISEPVFRRYTSRWPLGPPGSFYNSVGKMICLKDMKTKYLESTSKWLNKTFNFEYFSYAEAKFEEIENELESRMYD